MIGKIIKHIYRIICVATVVIAASIPAYTNTDLVKAIPNLQYITAGIFIFINLLPSLYNRRFLRRKHRVCADGAELLTIFMFSWILSVITVVTGLIRGTYIADPAKSHFMQILSIALAAFLINAVIFWNGIIRIYLTSTQLGIRYRIWGLLLGWIFPANLIMLGKMIKVANDEVHFENDKIVLNKKRHNDQICKTKYPLLMVHGVFFRDFKQGFLNYWGRVPEELRENGATVYYGNQQSAASVAECGAELAERIKAIVAETGCEKVNIIAHSKGGLDSRYAVSKCGVADMVASITTINTPHRGCEFADYLLNMIPAAIQSQVASTYNFALKRLGDPDPDFLEAVNDLTFAACNARNEEIKDVPGIFYQSYGSHMKKAGGGRFPLNYSFHLVKHFDGDNDGLVGEKSFEWGEHYEYLEPKGSRGISHGDVIDLNRENFDGFDVREFYVQIVHGLKEKGY